MTRKYFKITLSKIEERLPFLTWAPSPVMEFHIRRSARDRYEFQESIYSSSGNVILADFHASRLFAQEINNAVDKASSEKAVSTGQINALGFIDEILHYVIYLYRTVNRDVFYDAHKWLADDIGSGEVDEILLRFVDEFPTVDVYRENISPEFYLKGETGGIPNRHIAMEELMMLWLANRNPAFSRYNELFDDSELRKKTDYMRLMDSLNSFFETQPAFGPEKQNLMDMLYSPASAVPHSLKGQLEYIHQKWGMLPGELLFRLLSSLDLIAEEEKVRLPGPGPAEVPEYSDADDYEAFSRDRHWMPRLVLMAKSTLVWMDQLTQKYGRTIRKLDKIPDQELDSLAENGFTGLWLIGIWERSRSSRMIKRMCGNPEAEASAYSIHDYRISEELGGDEAHEALKARCSERGIRLVCDMVPNHTGIDSRWIYEHPDWFVSVSDSPFPSYSFTGENFSREPDVGIFIEDHYFDRSDAAVVFKHVNHETGEERYIYHGNDGTHLPWNDTAQLNYMKAEVREAVIQAIINAARAFPVIRFDAAMTLTRKHYQRLWFPAPGTGGDIPSRSERGMTVKEFNKGMPDEFWREVVDRVSEEAPGTLLLAEAFWLMEGYFVRTLGMHRVYNSAFMNMLKNEENANYRSLIKNTLAFDPEILKRFVNFMNNPDEETAAVQFGRGDKYFGICTMLVTMPGLPMFGHGQAEGFTEKYGMEYRRAYLDEQVDQEMVERHKREIFPLLKKRYIFAESENFLLYDFLNQDGSVNENVFAYTNRFVNERALVVYNNKFEHAEGRILMSVSAGDNNGSTDGTEVQKSLGEGLGIRNDRSFFYIMRDRISGLEIIRNCGDIRDNGLFLNLGAYKYRVYDDFREVRDTEGSYAGLEESLGGRGVPCIEDALREIYLKPVHDAFKGFANAEMMNKLLRMRANAEDPKPLSDIMDLTREDSLSFLRAIKEFSSSKGDEATLADEIAVKCRAVLSLESLNILLSRENPVKAEAALKFFNNRPEDENSVFATLLAWVFLHSIGRLGDDDYVIQSRAWIDEWLLGRMTSRLLIDIGLKGEDAEHAVRIIKLLTLFQDWFRVKEYSLKRESMLRELFDNAEIRDFLGVNRFNGILWYNKEAFEELLWWLFAVAVVKISSRSENMDKGEIINAYSVIHKWQAGHRSSGYQVDKLLEWVRNN